MKPLWNLVFGVISLPGMALAAPDEPPRVELPLGPYVRPGRPLDVRVIGGADRVRTVGTPWALPQGERGDEFILQMPESASAVLSLEIERSGQLGRATADVEVLPAGQDVVAISADGAPPPGARAVRLAPTGLPTVREGWLLLDDVGDGIAPAGVAEHLRHLRRLPAAARPFGAPLLFGADGAVFATTAALAGRAPRLPDDVGVLLALLAAVEVTLALVLRSRRPSPWRCAAWLGLPPLATLAFLLVPGRLPGALAATAVAIDGAHGRCVLVRVESRRAATARFELRPEWSGASMVRYSADDATVTEAETGREVRLSLGAGESRLFAYAMRSKPDGEREASSSPMSLDQPSPRAVPEALRVWVEGRGLEARGSDLPFTAGSLPRADGTVVIPAASVFVEVPLAK